MQTAKLATELRAGRPGREFTRDPKRRSIKGIRPGVAPSVRATKAVLAIFDKVPTNTQIDLKFRPVVAGMKLTQIEDILGIRFTQNEIVKIRTVGDVIKWATQRLESRARIRQYLGDKLSALSGKDVAKIKDSSKLIKDFGFDILTIGTLLLDIEKELKINFGRGAENTILSFGQLVNTVEELIFAKSD